MRILIVEDEENLAISLKMGLEKNGYAADYITDGEVAMHRMELFRNNYDIIILDLMLPKVNGFEICTKARSLGITVPILVLTARDSVDDKIAALDAGADDYMVKPFSFEELLARVRAILRRPDDTLPNKLKIGDILLDPSTRKVFLKNRDVFMTLKEFSILEYLMRHPNQVLNREQILDHIWDFNFDSFSNVIDVHIKNIRKKINDGQNKTTLETVRGVGYRLKE